MAAAALAVSLASSQATPVYSQNVVGYATLPAPNSSYYYLLETPFVEGTSNGANEVFGTTGVDGVGTLPDGSEILTWSVAGQDYTTYVFDASYGVNPSGWYDQYYNNATIPILAPGQGFFLAPSAPMNNTYVGTVAVNISASKNQNLPNSSYYYLVGSLVPFSGPVNGVSSVNLTGLPDGSEMLQWSVASQSYTTEVYDSSYGADANNWYDQYYNNIATPSINVGDGFFVAPAAPYVWSQTLNP